MQQRLSSFIFLKVLYELGEVFALERTLRDFIPKRFGLFSRYLVIGRSKVKNQIVRVRDVSAGRCPAKDSECPEVRTPRGSCLTDYVSLRRFFVPGADSFQRFGDSTLVALQPHTYCPVGVVASIAREIVLDRLLLDHCPVADLLNVLAYHGGGNRFFLSVGRG